MTFELIFQEPALRFFMTASPDDQEKLEHCFDNLRIQPYADFMTKFPMAYRSRGFSLHRDGGFDISYRFKGNTVIEVLSIEPAENTPPPSEWLGTRL